MVTPSPWADKLWELWRCVYLAPVFSWEREEVVPHRGPLLVAGIIEEYVPGLSDLPGALGSLLECWCPTDFGFAQPWSGA